MLSMVCFALQKPFSLLWSHLFIFAAVAFACFQQGVARTDVRELTAMLSPGTCMDSGLTFNSSIHFEFVFVYGVRKWSMVGFFACT